MKKIGLLTTSLLIVCATMAQESVKMTAGKFNDYGLSYTLPATEIQLVVEYDEIIAKAGPFAAYAERYIGAPATIKADASYCELKQISIQTAPSVKDGVNYVAVVKNQIPYVYLNKDGVILSINREPISQTKDLVSVPDTVPETKKTSSIAVFNEEMLLSGSTAKMAENAAKQLYRIRESRVNLLTGDVDNLPADGLSFKLVTDGLNDQEQALVALFMGTIERKKMVKVLSVSPKDELSRMIIGRYSNFFGVVDKDNLAGEPIYLSVTKTEQMPEELVVDEKEKKKSNAPLTGFAYRVPAQASIQVEMSGRIIAESEAKVAQLGKIMHLPTNLFENKKAPISVLFFPETGAIREIGQ